MANNIRYDGPKGVSGGGGSIIKSIQRGEAFVTNVDLDIALSAIVLANSYVRMTGTQSDGIGDDADNVSPMLKITSTTNLNISRSATTGGIYVTWEVIEFEEDGFESIEVIDYILPKATINPNIAISAVDMNKSMVFATEKSADVGGIDTYNLGYQIISPTSLNIRTYKFGRFVNTTVTIYIVQLK
jgi:hypothetical protein